MQKNEMRRWALLWMLLFPVMGFCQSSYSGVIGDYPVTLVAFHYSDGVARAHYAYDKVDTPIPINGRLAGGVLTLFERDAKGQVSAVLVFPDFDEKKPSLEGVWLPANATKSLDIRLKKDFDIPFGEGISWEERALLQSQSTNDHYFKTLVSKTKDDFYARVTGVEIFEKGTDRLLQRIKLDCQLSTDSISIGDYNFDGVQDFSVFEASYAGPNTSRVYLLRKPRSDEYVVSDFTGTSLDFDPGSKRIYEHNQCCGGRSHMNATYKVVNNHMVLIERACHEFDGETGDLVKVKCE
jgi:hypothetical protein